MGKSRVRNFSCPFLETGLIFLRPPPRSVWLKVQAIALKRPQNFLCPPFSMAKTFLAPLPFCSPPPPVISDQSLISPDCNVIALDTLELHHCQWRNFKVLPKHDQNEIIVLKNQQGLMLGPGDGGGEGWRRFGGSGYTRPPPPSLIGKIP